LKNPAGAFRGAELLQYRDTLEFTQVCVCVCVCVCVLRLCMCVCECAHTHGYECV